MQRILILSFTVLFAVVMFTKAENADDQFVAIYRLINEGDQLAASGQMPSARERYLQAQTALRKLQASHPTWNEKVVLFRLNYLEEKIGPLPVPVEKAAPPAAILTPGSARGSAENAGLIERIQYLERQNGLLEVKLREALGAQPAAVDPRELARAEEKIKLLEKEKEILKVSLQQALRNGGGNGANAAVAKVKAALAEAEEAIRKHVEQNAALATERDNLRKELELAKAAPGESPVVAAMRKENDGLKAEVQALRSRPKETPAPVENGKKIEEARRNLEQKQAQVMDLEKSLRQLQVEKGELEKAKRDLEVKVASLTARPLEPRGSDPKGIAEVKKERDELMKKLNETTRQLYDNKSKSRGVERDQVNNQVTLLRARLEVLEAKKVPYTPEELALFKEPVAIAAKADPQAPKRTARELPRATLTVLAEAERAFMGRRFEEAEAKYKEVLEADKDNVFTLANLAASQMEQNRMDDAEVHLKRAISLEPSDAHSLSLLGILNFRKERYDEALSFLSQASGLDPKNPETQNYLGITLSQKGQRGAAEAALRKAIQLAPGYGGAHHNLAVVYATQQPAFTELARWHYQKALASGHPQNLDLERLIEKGRKPAASP